MQLLTSLRAVGIDPAKFLGYLGMDVSNFEKMFGSAIATPAAEAAAETEDTPDVTA